MRKKVFDPQAAQHQAMQLFWKKGYAQTSMDEILTTIGISRSSFYNTFGDKRQLYEAVLNDFASLSQAATLVLAADKPIKALLTDFFDISFIKHGVSTSQGCLLVNTVLEQEAHDPELAKQASKFLNMIEEAIEKALRQAVDKGELPRDTDTLHLASYLITMIKGLRVASKQGKSKMELKHLFHSSLIILDKVGEPL